MMLVLEVVTTAFFLVAGAAAQKPTTLADASSSSVDVNYPARENGPVLGTLFVNIGQDPLYDGEIDDYKRNEIFGKDLDSEEQEENSSELDESYNDDSLSDEDDEDDDDIFDADDDEDKPLDQGESTEGGDETNGRFKRKVIFRGGGGGGIYSRGGRRNNGNNEEDPYGRRRDNGGGDYEQDSWPYRRQDTPYQDPAVKTSTTSTGSVGKTESSAVYGTTRISPPDAGPPAGGSSSSSSTSSSSSSSSTSNASGRKDGKKTKTNRRETAKVKLSKNLKSEIAQYAMTHGSQKASEHFEHQIGRKLRVKKIDKFVKRYRSKM